MFCPSRCVCIFQINNFSVIMGDFFLNNKQIDMIGQVMQIEFSQIFIGKNFSVFSFFLGGGGGGGVFLPFIRQDSK